jgi:hypothetical protein
MKRVGNLFEAIPERENLRLAVCRALRGKRASPEARLFTANLEQNLKRMAEELHAGTIEVGRFHQFVIYDPKERIITAPCFRERVLHHAIINVCEPHFERWLIPDSYACRKNKGRVKALERAGEYARQYGWFLKLDIRKYFDSVPHDRLLGRLAQRFKDRRLLELFARIVRSFRGNIGCGLPIGSLTSQHFANFYLGWFDRYAKEQLRIPGYVRYMDDMAFWSNDKEDLKRALSCGEVYLREELGLALKPSPYLNRTTHGMEFLGCRVFAHHRTLNRRSRVRFRRRLGRLEDSYHAGVIDEHQLQAQATSLVAFTRSAGVSSWRFRQAIVESLVVDGHKAPTACFGAAAGTTTAGTAGRRTATGTRQRTGTRTTGSGSP